MKLGPIHKKRNLLHVFPMFLVRGKIMHLRRLCFSWSYDQENDTLLLIPWRGYSNPVTATACQPG